MTFPGSYTGCRTTPVSPGSTCRAPASSAAPSPSRCARRHGCVSSLCPEIRPQEHGGGVWRCCPPTQDSSTRGGGGGVGGMWGCGDLISPQPGLGVTLGFSQHNYRGRKTHRDWKRKPCRNNPFLMKHLLLIFLWFTFFSSHVSHSYKSTPVKVLKYPGLKGKANVWTHLCTL